MLAVAALLVFLPWVRQDKMAAFWFAAMLFAVIPAATVMPIGKNLGFVSVGGCGLIASFVAALVSGRLPTVRGYRALAGIACVLLLLVHIPGAAAGRVLAVKGTRFALKGLTIFSDIGNPPGVENQNVVVVNAPCYFALAYAPAYKIYEHEPLPKTMRMLVPGCTGYDVERTDDRTLVIQAKGADMFSCDEVGRIHFAYAFRTANLAIAKPQCKAGDRYEVGGLTVEVLQVDAENLPSRVAFRFDTSLDAGDFQWVQFDWRTLGYETV